ncbi:MAG: CPBP family intramembrane glutamic endopeptidase [Chloroflexota bacterium]
MNAIRNATRTIFTFRWQPGLDVVAVLGSCLLVTASLYTATIIVTPEAGGGMPYFFLYAGLTALLFGIGLPLAWMVLYRKRSIQDLGITAKYLGLSIVLQLVFSLFQYLGTLAKTDLPTWSEMLPLLGLALAIGFFEALFWRGWVLLRLEEAFGLIPAVILGSLLYALYHVGYGMLWAEIAFLFWIGVLYAVCFRFTRSIFILWPVFQPMGQLVTLVRDGLHLPTIAALGFFEAWILMLVLIWLAYRYERKHKALLT